MSKKFDNKTLIIVFVILVAIFVYVKFYHSVKTESTLKTELVKLDTFKITKILLYPTAENREEIQFLKEGNRWKVSKGKIVAEPQNNAVSSLLAQLLEIKPQSLASRAKDKWAEFRVNDSTATKIKVFEGKKLKLDLYIGKFTYQKGNNMYAMYGSGGTGTSYVRLAGENEIYAINGFLTFAFNQPFISWRDQALAKINKSNITSFAFKYPGDSSFSVILQNKQWIIKGQKADSAKVADYLGSLSYKNGSSFDDNFIPSGSPICELTLEGNNMSAVTIQAWIKGNNQYVLNSSINPKSWFTDNSKTLFSQIFKNSKSFFQQQKKK
jgi:hypothetical protein